MRKQNTKKLTAYLLAFALALAAVGCGSSKEQETAASETIGGDVAAGTELDTENAASSEASSEAASTQDTVPSDPALHFEEQELYTADNIIVTVPEQTLKRLYYDNANHESRCVYQDLELHFECGDTYFPSASFLDAKINGKPITQPESTYLDSGENTYPFYLEGNDIGSSEVSGEITFVLRLFDHADGNEVKTDITIPYMVVEE